MALDVTTQCKLNTKTKFLLYICESWGAMLNLNPRLSLCGQYLWVGDLMGLRASLGVFEKRNIS